MSDMLSAQRLLVAGSSGSNPSRNGWSVFQRVVVVAIGMRVGDVADDAPIDDHVELAGVFAHGVSLRVDRRWARYSAAGVVGRLGSRMVNPISRLSARATRMIVSRSGWRCPASIFAIQPRETPAFLASSAWLRPWVMRRSLRRVETRATVGVGRVVAISCLVYAREHLIHVYEHVQDGGEGAPVEQVAQGHIADVAFRAE